MKKGQVLSLDFIIAIFIFIGLMTFIFWAWNFTTIRQQDYRETSELTMMAKQVAENLISNQGNPSNWHELENLSTVSSIGLMSGNELSLDKINSISGFNYNIFKKKSGVLGPRYELGIKIYIFDNTDYILYSEYGQTNTSKSVLIQRHVIVNDTFGRFDVYIGAK